ncbi:signal transduction histidine kinase [Bacillus sp. SORGH_AS 510]|uniref:hypothetical protein n=1 Tax=Bacillus sp. SORGH_AS_0510 TaxID=3041771 RepID=UPI0027833011|nr:hypothetical protein [Bacillus sp. SORGH_AS_0510]MDQ1143880.1 signal transduction histidine kinase [Bacillus sp. SORGH_AS_0510]
MKNSKDTASSLKVYRTSRILLAVSAIFLITDLPLLWGSALFAVCFFGFEFLYGTVSKSAGFIFSVVTLFVILVYFFATGKLLT